MKCPECQFENRKGVKFCEECGSKFELECPTCKTNVPIGRKFCGECGYNLSNSEEPVQPYAKNHQTQISDSPHEGTIPLPSPAEGERKHVTVLFSDLSGYTAISEKLDPEDVKAITSKMFGEISKIVGKYDGFIEKYAGDAVMALFGVPMAHEDDPNRAVKAAQGIHDLADKMSPEVEMAELADAIENLNRGKGRIFSIIGDAGTGKSRLVEEFKATIDLREIKWLEGHAYAYTQNIPYFPMIDLFMWNCYAESL